MFELDHRLAGSRFAKQENIMIIPVQLHHHAIPILLVEGMHPFQLITLVGMLPKTMYRYRVPFSRHRTKLNFNYITAENSTMLLSIWEKESFFAPADIVIAGSGLVGLWSAYYLKKKAPRLSITVVERGLIPSGASTRNAGF